MPDHRETGALPNLLLATTYALNKSNSKRICVGLEVQNDVYRPVVKIGSVVSAYQKIITLDVDQWEALKNHFDTIGSYFNRCYDFHRQFGSNHTGSIPGYEIKYGTTYGHKSIIIDEKLEEPNAQHFVEEDQTQSIADQTPKSKKKKDSYPAGIAMQGSTFDGLVSHAPLIDLSLDILKPYVVEANRTVDTIIEYLNENLTKENITDRSEIARIKNIVQDIRVFKQYFATNFAAIAGYVEAKTHNYDDYMKLMMKEILAFGLYDLRNIFENHLNSYKYFSE